jgi:ATP/maltotriose-dependent transcriptional regulator MalT
VGSEGLVAAGRAAILTGRWHDACAAFEAAAAEEETPEVLDGLGEVRYRQGDYAAAIKLRERAYAGFRARGDTRYPAVLAAYYLAFDYAAVFGNVAAASGWLERGKRLAAVSGDCVERGWVELACVLATDDLDEKEHHIAAAADIARRFADSDLEFDALAYSGVCLVERGHIGEGLRRLDEAAAAALGGEVSSYTAMGEIYCKILLACELILDVRRAEQWSDAAKALSRRANLAWASAICRMHYGGILIAAGRWAEAEAELGASVRLYDRGYQALRSGAVVRLADLRVRQGQLDEAQRLLDGHAHDAYTALPLSRLHLARGELDLAVTVLRRHLDATPAGVVQVPALALLGEAYVVAGRRAEARAIGRHLAAVAKATPMVHLRAVAAFVIGLSGEGPKRVGCLESALSGFTAAGMPYEAARTRVELARVFAADQPAVAVAETKAALRTFDELGATTDADSTAALLRSLGVRGRTGPRATGVLSKREEQVLGLLGLGLSNPEIATRLFISRKTAAHHVSSILAKLALRNRADAAAYSRDHPPPR